MQAVVLKSDQSAERKQQLTLEIHLHAGNQHGLPDAFSDRDQRLCRDSARDGIRRVQEVDLPATFDMLTEKLDEQGDLGGGLDFHATRILNLVPHADTIVGRPGRDVEALAPILEASAAVRSQASLSEGHDAAEQRSIDAEAAKAVTVSGRQPHVDEQRRAARIRMIGTGKFQQAVFGHRQDVAYPGIDALRLGQPAHNARV